MIDNFDLYDMEERRLARAERLRPHCDLCDEPIWDEYGYRVGEYLVCERCMEDAKERIEEDFDD